MNSDDSTKRFDKIDDHLGRLDTHLGRLDTRMERQGQRLEQQGQRLEQLDKLVLQLFGHFSKELADTKAELSNEMTNIRDQLQSSIDGLYRRSETEQDERTVMAHQLDRHEAWIEKASPKLKIDYDRAA